MIKKLIDLTKDAARRIIGTPPPDPPKEGDKVVVDGVEYEVGADAYPRTDRRQERAKAEARETKWRHPTVHDEKTRQPILDKDGKRIVTPGTVAQLMNHKVMKGYGPMKRLFRGLRMHPLPTLKAEDMDDLEKVTAARVKLRRQRRQIRRKIRIYESVPHTKAAMAYRAVALAAMNRAIAKTRKGPPKPAEKVA